MVDNFQKKSFLRSSEGAIASYDWYDFASGAGYKEFYPCVSEISGAVSYFLTNKTAILNDSDYLAISLTTNNSSYASTDLDYDIEFKSSLTIDGECFISIPFYMNTPNTMYFIVNIYHVDLSSTETLLGTVTSNSETTSGSTKYEVWTSKVTLTKKRFHIGEKLRVNIQQYGIKGSAGNSNVQYYLDPAGRTTITDGGSGTSVAGRTIISIPFEVEI